MGNTVWKALLYVQEEIAKEKELQNWIETKAFMYGIKSLAVPVPVSKHNIKLAMDMLRVRSEECLMIVTTDREWQAANELGIAALPYCDFEMSKLEEIVTPIFEGAWIVVEGFEEVDFSFLHRVYLRYHGLPWEILKTKRCIVRELALSDMDALFALYAKPGVTEYMEGLFPYEEELEYQRAYIENMYRYFGYGMWLVCRHEDGAVIGRAGFEHREYDGVVELDMGYLIAPEEQQKGIATEICRAMIEYAADNLDFPRINCLIESGNTASIRLVSRLGFTFFETIYTDKKEMLRYIFPIVPKTS